MLCRLLSPSELSQSCSVPLQRCRSVMLPGLTTAQLVLANVLKDGVLHLSAPSSSVKSVMQSGRHGTCALRQ